MEIVITTFNLTKISQFVFPGCDITIVFERPDALATHIHSIGRLISDIREMKNVVQSIPN